MPEIKTYEVYSEVTTYIKASGKEIANFTAIGRSSGSSVDGLAKAVAPALADALATSARMLKAVEG
jgi:hypothetical protein